MKKYISLAVILLSFFMQAGAKGYLDQPQDSGKLYKQKLIPDVIIENQDNETIDLSDLELEIPDLSMLENVLEDLEQNISEMSEKLSTSIATIANGVAMETLDTSTFADQQEGKKPTRIENKDFTNVSEIEIDQKYGNIVVRESDSKNVSLEIQYFDVKNEKASCDISISKGILFIATTSSKKAKVNYVISVPKNISLNILQKYGNVKVGDYSGAFSADLSYSNLDAQSFSAKKPIIKAKYGNITIGTVSDLSFSGAYTKVKIEKGNNIYISGNYADYILGSINALSAEGSSAYGNLKIGNVASVSADFKYTDLSIDNLISDINLKCAYSGIQINSSSNKLNNITMNGIYSDMTITLPADISASFTADLIYGDFSISKKYIVTYTEQQKRDSKVFEKGKIGTKTPKLTISVSNKYADTRIR